MMQPKQQPMGRGGQPPQGRPQPQGPMAQGGQPNVPPELQQQAEQVVTEVKQMLSANGGAVLKEMVNAVKDPQVDHVNVLANALVMAVDGLSQKLGGLPEPVLLAAAVTILQMVEQGMAASKVQPLTPEDRKAILRQAVMLYREKQGQGGQQGQPPQGQPMGQPPMPQQGALAMAAGV